MTKAESAPRCTPQTTHLEEVVDTLHARKMVALLQAITGGATPILLRSETRAGHGAGKPLAKIIDEEIDVRTCIGWQLGVVGITGAADLDCILTPCQPPAYRLPPLLCRLRQASC
jgi:hypothetical protein